MQVVDYEPARSDQSATLLVATEEGLRRESLQPQRKLAYTLGSSHCAGRITDEGHVPCPRPETPYCSTHTETWICARCTGTCLKDEMDCYDPHAVYLAGFAPSTVKVGVTREWRLETRLREQGADVGAKIFSVENGRIAREIEADLAMQFTDAVRIRTKIAGLHQSMDPEVWTHAISAFDVLENFSFDYGINLVDRPVVETIASGLIVGTKGRILLLDRVGTTYAVDLRELVGFELLPGSTDRNIQTSFATFD